MTETDLQGVPECALEVAIQYMRRASELMSLAAQPDINSEDRKNLAEVACFWREAAFDVLGGGAEIRGAVIN